MMSRTGRIALIGILTALLLVFSLLENLLPPILAAVPYAKIGFANLVILTALVLFPSYYALVLVIAKCLFMGIFSGNMGMLLYSLPASIASWAMMAVCLRHTRLTLVCVSILSAMLHNVIQIAVAVVVTKTVGVAVYLPHMLLFGGISGAVIGIVVRYVVCSDVVTRAAIGLQHKGSNG